MTRVLVITPDRDRECFSIRLAEIVKRAVDECDWDGTRWRFRFQSHARLPHEGDPILRLYDQDWEIGIRRLPPSADDRDPLYRTIVRQATARGLARSQSAASWHLRRAGDGVEGWFDAEMLPRSSKDKKPFCSFDTEFAGEVRRCQFHIWEIDMPSSKPTAWENRRGASAGYPTLGKRR